MKKRERKVDDSAVNEAEAEALMEDAAAADPSDMIWMNAPTMNARTRHIGHY